MTARASASAASNASERPGPDGDDGVLEDHGPTLPGRRRAEYQGASGWLQRADERRPQECRE